MPSEPSNHGTRRTRTRQVFYHRRPVRAADAVRRPTYNGRRQDDVAPSSVMRLLVWSVLFLAVLLCALWLRKRMPWTPLGRFFYRLGFSGANGTISDLKEGRRYIVTQSFPDYESVAVGEVLTFRHQQFVDHAGYVLQFEEREIILKEGGDAARRIWAYLEPLRR